MKFLFIAFTLLFSCTATSTSHITIKEQVPDELNGKDDIFFLELFKTQKKHRSYKDICKNIERKDMPLLESIKYSNELRRGKFETTEEAEIRINGILRNRHEQILSQVFSQDYTYNNVKYDIEKSQWYFDNFYTSNILETVSTVDQYKSNKGSKDSYYCGIKLLENNENTFTHPMKRESAKKIGNNIGYRVYYNVVLKDRNISSGDSKRQSNKYSKVEVTDHYKFVHTKALAIILFNEQQILEIFTL